MKLKSILGLVLIASACGIFFVMTASAAQSINGGSITVGESYSNDYFLVEREQAHQDDKVVFGSCTYNASRFIDSESSGYPPSGDINFAILVNGRDYELKGLGTSVGGYPSPNRAASGYPDPVSTSGIESYNLCFVNETLGINQCGVASFYKGEASHGISSPSETSNIRTLPFDDRCLAGVTPINALNAASISNHTLYFPMMMK